MLRLIFRKILNNKWMVICLIIGCTFAIAVAAAIPMYTSGMYNVLLANEFKKEQDKFSTFPFKASYNATFFGLNNNTSQTIFNDLDNTFYNEYLANMPVKKVFDYKNVTTKSYSMFDEQNYKIKQQKIDDGEQLSSRNLNVKSDFSITSAANAPDMLDIIGGRMFQTSTEEGVIEAVITQLAAAQYRLSVGEYYYIYNKILDVDLIAKVKIVGIVKVNESSSSFFTLSDRTLLVDFDQMQNMIKESLITLQQANWFAAFDYTTVRLEFNEDIIKATQTLKVSDGNSSHILSASNNYITILDKYSNDTLVMQKVFLLLIVPVILMIGMYVVMISQLMMEREKSEIATLESRGASRNQIFFIYFGQGVVLSIISFIFGMLLARNLCRLLGAANGFMEFVNRTAIEIKFNVMSIIYAIICAVIYLIMILVPAYKASKYSIVQHKQNISDGSKKSFWQIIFLDFILIGISLYFLYDYESMSQYIQKVQSSSIDFTLFIAVTLFIMGLGLLFIRLFPYIVKLIFLLAKKHWKPAAYTAFMHVARGGNYKQFIMIFLILAISIGIFNANAGRTLNENLEDNIRYSIGADAAFVPATITYNESTGSFDFINNTGTVLVSNAETFCKSDLINNYSVYYYYNTKIKPSDESVTFMGIEPYEFGQVVKMRKDLNEGLHINNILNTLSTYPQGVIISRAIADEYGTQEGQYFNYIYESITSNNGVEENLVVNVLVVAVVDYWPTMTNERFIIMTRDNYSIMKDFSDRGKILIDKKDGALDSAVLADIKGKMSEDDSIGNMSFVDYEVTQAKKNSILNGMNGILTLDFLISMIICCVGFIIFWIISVRQRILQFGIFRAMGMSKNELYRMIFYEQLMISFVSIVAGILIGGIASQMFVPLFERMSTMSNQYVPFSTYQDGIDYIRIYVITGLSLIIGLSVLLRFISKLKIDQALKLGED
ncbi:MAG TPA: FtsX-like permease family protein [Clostridia bacterium]|nr:MAG: FtsX-like permease family protein [Firmicutes bacterium ADurb.Bin146]HOD92472.1 FtsX-like permease family protein [Clostridia bacterium]HQM38829.1 FtsX-like permease family protein [Clostridia bacterium]